MFSLIDASSNALRDGRNSMRRSINPTGYEQGAGDALRDMLQPGSFRRSMDDFMNPYREEVINQGLSRIGDDRRQAIAEIGGAASTAGAYGGDRQAILEAETYDDFGRRADEFVSNLLMSGFDTAGNLAATSTGLDQSAAGALAGLGGQISSRQLAGGNALSQYGQDAYNMASQINAAVGQSGDAQQRMMQGLLDAAQGKYDEYVNRPQEAIDVVLAALGGTPLNNARTQTSQYKPGLFDFLSLGTQLGGAYLGGG